MAFSSTPRATSSTRRRGRPPGSKSSSRATSARPALPTGTTDSMATDPPPKKRKYIPGGPGGGGRFVETDEFDTPITYRTATASRPRPSARRSTNGASPAVSTRRPRSTRTRSFPGENSEDVRWGSAAAMAASVQQAEDYKPREERGWEEFHPNLDIEATFMLFSADEVDGISQAAIASPASEMPQLPTTGLTTPSLGRASSTSGTPNLSLQNEVNPFDQPTSATPTRRPRRMTRDLLSFHGSRPMDLSTPKAPKILPIQNQTPKERLDLKLPSYRQVNHIESFRDTHHVRDLDPVFTEVGYQEHDTFPRPTRNLYKAIDGNPDDDVPSSPWKPDSDSHPKLGPVEYDMDEQDDMWLDNFNDQRKQDGLAPISREVFEITMTKIEKEWHALEKRIPKPNPKPPQTHRPRSSSAAAVNGEPQAGEEPDSKCAICDDGDCENTNAIVFCDGCNLAVHQECYGVPFIPEGQWMCRKCQLCGRGVPTCIFCPNTDGAFKQTNSSKWAHLLCAMWIPEVSLGNHTFMEPVMEVEKVPKTRWKLSCYICHQKMGACIQCSNKNCYQAFHVTCARRARLSLKMKTTQGTLAVLDGSMVLKAYCDKHCSPEHAAENSVHDSTRAAKRFYKRNMRGRIWADNHSIANMLAARQNNAVASTPAEESQMKGESNSIALSGSNNDDAAKNVWKLPSGAPVIPQAVFGAVDDAIHQFPCDKRAEYLGEACRYWTLKREARRGAALLKRLQLQMESFSSMELTRRNFAAMGPSGKARLLRRVEFAQNLVRELEQLRVLSRAVVEREELKMEAVELERSFVDACYFPIVEPLVAAMETAVAVETGALGTDLTVLQDAVKRRTYVTVVPFAQDLAGAVQSGIMSTPGLQPTGSAFSVDTSVIADEIRKRRDVGERILQAVQPHLQTALRLEAASSGKNHDTLQREIEGMVQGALDTSKALALLDSAVAESGADTEMDDVREAREAGSTVVEATASAAADSMDLDDEVPGAPSADGVPLAPAQTESNGRMSEHDSEAQAKVDSKAFPSPPDMNGALVHLQPAKDHTEPLTPPQSNGSLGQERSESALEGGVLWYLEEFEPVGTSATVRESWAGREAIRMLSEDLTDMDDDELKGLGLDVAEAMKSFQDEAAGEEQEQRGEGREDTRMSAKARAKERLSREPATARRMSARRRQ